MSLDITSLHGFAWTRIWVFQQPVKAKQRIIIELYDEFFRNAFPKMTERLGIVYTPVEVVDFIIHSINDVLKSEFKQSLGSKNVHIIDPFTGTGTFITRLLQSGLISREELAYKYQNEIHANEIVLLAYYIAAINIEQVYHSIMGGDYVPFNGICLTDTFALYEKEPSQKDAFKTVAENSGRRKKQKALDIRVIMGNPPYSAGQTSANDNNANVSYETLDDSIRSTYAMHSKATNKNALYDSYIRAIRWASDRVGKSGIIGFVTNAGFMDANTADGLRKCLADEFSSIYVFHLRGNQRTSGELSRQEGGKIFGSGSRAPIAISLLVKNPDAKEQGMIVLHDIGDYLSREDKLEKISTFKSIDGISAANGWLPITPDQHHDWVNQRDDSFGEFLSLGDKKDMTAVTVFESYSCGIQTNRDAWIYNGSKSSLEQNMLRMIDFYNAEVSRYRTAIKVLPKDQRIDIDGFLNNDETKIKWSSSLKPKVERGILCKFEAAKLVRGLYRPYSKQWAYFDTTFNHRPYQMPRIFPNSTIENRVICLTVTGTKCFSVIISDVLTDLHLIGDAQCFPFKLYEPQTEKNAKEPGLAFEGGSLETRETTSDGAFAVKDGITDAGLQHFKEAYLYVAGASEISKEDLFYSLVSG